MYMPLCVNKMGPTESILSANDKKSPCTIGMVYVFVDTFCPLFRRTSIFSCAVGVPGPLAVSIVGLGLVPTGVFSVLSKTVVKLS